MSAVIPRHRVNVLTGFKSAKLIEDPAEYANLIKSCLLYTSDAADDQWRV